MTAKILIVDDRLEMRELVAASLQKLDCEFLLADNGVDGWRIIRSDLPDLVVLDIMMPGVIDGLALLRRLRASPETASCRVLLLSAKGQQEDLAEGFHAGADAYVVKPFSPKELVRLVDDLLSKQ